MKKFALTGCRGGSRPSRCFCAAKAHRRQAKNGSCSWRSIRKSEIFGGRVMTLPYSVRDWKRKAAIRSAHCRAAEPDSVEPSSWWWRATPFWLMRPMDATV